MRGTGWSSPRALTGHPLWQPTNGCTTRFNLVDLHQIRLGAGHGPEALSYRVVARPSENEKAARHCCEAACVTALLTFRRRQFILTESSISASARSIARDPIAYFSLVQLLSSVHQHRPATMDKRG